MEGQYYTHGAVYGRDYPVASVGSYPQHSNCIYGGKPATMTPGHYGGQTMSVVDQQGLGPGDMVSLHPQLSVAIPHPGANTHTPGQIHHPHAHPHPHMPHHLTPTPLQPHHQFHPSPTRPGHHPQPPPAHSHHPDVHTKQEGKSSSSGSPNRLHFPWMKTTKSHAHQWKANWPGKPKRQILPIRFMICLLRRWIN